MKPQFRVHNPYGTGGQNPDVTQSVTYGVTPNVRYVTHGVTPTVMSEQNKYVLKTTG